MWKYILHTWWASCTGACELWLWCQAEPTQQGRTYFDRRLGQMSLDVPNLGPPWACFVHHMSDQCWILLKIYLIYFHCYWLGLNFFIMFPHFFWQLCQGSLRFISIVKVALMDETAAHEAGKCHRMSHCNFVERGNRESSKWLKHFRYLEFGEIYSNSHSRVVASFRFADVARWFLPTQLMWNVIFCGLAGVAGIGSNGK